MCGRFSETAKIEKISRAFGIPKEKIPALTPRYNIAPSQNIAAIIQESGKEREIQLFRWGLTPSWSKDPAIRNKMINARAETLMTQPSFSRPLKKNRCLVIADGFFEWKKEERASKPYYIRLKSGDLFTFAGLWDEWKDPSGRPLRPCTIITGEPNELIRPIHNRSPVILPKPHRDLWLDPDATNLEELVSLLNPYPAGEMDAYPVSTLVNSADHDIPECIQELKGLSFIED